MLIVVVILALPMRAQQKPFTRDQVQGLVRDGLGDESGAKLIEQRGIDFAPTEDFLQSLQAAGASEAFLQTLRAAKPPELVATVSALVTVGLSFDDEPRVNSKDELTVSPVRIRT